MNQTELNATTCCFFGHRETKETEELKQQLYSIIENLILDYNVDTFLFGSKSRFNNLCYKQVTKIKEKYPYIKRVYVRAEFPEISESYATYLRERYEDTYYPQKALGAGKAVYVERNFDMINKSRFCIAYCKENCSPANRKSGTKLALNYAIKKNREIIILPNLSRAADPPKKASGGRCETQTSTGTY